MKTRDRILECALQLFNQQGEPNVSTLEIANELGISPGNLYYHFHGKEPLIHGLFERFEDALMPLLDPPVHVRLDAEDYWLFLHLIVERMRVEQITLTLWFSLDYQRVLGREGDVGVVVYQVMLLVTPHLHEQARDAAQALAMRYLEV